VIVVRQNVLLFFLMILVAVPAMALRDGEDHVQFGSNVVVHEGETAGDIVCFFCSVDVEGKASDVVVFLGNAKINGDTGDVVVLGGRATLTSNATTQDVVVGGRVDADPNAVIRGDRTTFTPLFVVLPFIVFAIMVWLFVLLLKAIFGRPRQRVIYVPQPPPGAAPR
jgi:hypothetical protein